jgi:DNA-binding NarL/FixJ family response regulator
MASKKQILCIDDNRESAAMLAADLSERGFAVTIACNGHEGISALLDNHPDLVICDINMPVMSGVEVLERLNALSPSYQDVPFIFLTSFVDRDIELQCRMMGADDFVSKPVDYEILGTIIEARLARVARRNIWRAAVDLNHREVDTLTWSARGKTSGEIAQILGLSKRSVDFHLDSARAKLNVATRTQAVVKAVTGRLIEP